MSKPLLEISGLSKKFCSNPHRALRYFLADTGREILCRPPSSCIREDEFWALRDVAFSLHSGEVLGVIGHNGAGKSTLINLIAGLIRPTTGEIILRTKRVALMDHGGGLNSSQTGRENIRSQLFMHGYPSEMIPSKEQSVIEFAEISTFIDSAVGTYSLGMRQRLAFSIYTQLDPDLFIVDEALNGGDLRFRTKFASFLREYVGRGGSILLCSHELHAIQMLCPRSILLEQGKLVMCGISTDVIAVYHQMHAEQEQNIEAITAATCMEGELQTKATPNESDEIKITSVSAKNPKEQPIFPGGEINLEIRFHSTSSREGVFCAVEIGNELLESLSTMVFGYPPESLRLRAGENFVYCRFKSLPLAPGTYQVRVYLTEKDTAIPLATFGVETRPMSFIVTKAADPKSNMAVYRKNILHLEPEWWTA